jgi:hypothetical protein
VALNLEVLSGSAKENENELGFRKIRRKTYVEPQR